MIFFTFCSSFSSSTALMTSGPLTAYSIFLTQGFMLARVRVRSPEAAEAALEDMVAKEGEGEEAEEPILPLVLLLLLEKGFLSFKQEAPKMSG